jgi:PST family polysaccharide transporter
VWSFVLGQAAGIVASTIVLVAAAPYHVKPQFKLSAVREALKSGRGFVLQGSTAYLAVNADYLIIAKVLGPSALGAYSLAFRYAELPYYAVAEPVAQVTFPGFARMWSRNEDVTPSYLSTLRLVALVSCPLGIMLSACAAPLVHTLLGPQWSAAIGPLVALGLWSVVRQVQSTAGWLLNSVGRADSMGLASIVSLLWLFPSVYAAAELIGLVGVAVVMLANMVVGLVWCAFLIRRHVGITLRTQWVALRGIAVSCSLSWLAGWASAAALGGVPYAVALIGSATACAVAYLAGIATMDRPVLRAAINNARRLLDRGTAMSERAAVA